MLLSCTNAYNLTKRSVINKKNEQCKETKYPCYCCNLVCSKILDGKAEWNKKCIIFILLIIHSRVNSTSKKLQMKC